MIISKNIESAINNQINKELYSAYLYLSMSANFESNNLKGFANWMKVQAKEENNHAIRFYDYLFSRNGRVILTQIHSPKTEWKTPLESFEEAYEHELSITKSINEIRELAEKEKDSATISMLKWFIDEQVEEESSTFEIVQKLKMAKDSTGVLLYLDHELGKRKFGGD